ncbi:MAG: aspartate aminotransferase family protein [Lachnospiraceae bacterium]|nr:aspartate aminotransferase family protein [Lachnospiraceae bacterium]
MNKQEAIAQGEAHLLHTYNRFPMVLDHGDGMYLYETDGTKYLDFAAGIAVFAFGYGNKTYNDALKAQIDKLVHTSNLYYNEPSVVAAKLFCEASGMDRVFFTNSGAEAIEGALKLARKYYYNKHGVSGSNIIAMDHSFHGRTMGAVSVTGKKAYREPFEPLVGGVTFATFNDYDDVVSKADEKTCAIIMETVQGEGGIYPADPEFMKKIRKFCTEHDICLILDEIQCGMGRTGTMFAYQQYGIEPDILTSAKALGCGVPVGCFACKEAFAAMVPGDHGSTYGGNPFVTKAVETVFGMFKDTDILTNVKETGAYLWDALEAVKKDFPNVVSGHRGLGLMQGLVLSVPVGPVVKEVISQGCILISAGTDVIRFVPPLIAKPCHVDEMITCLRNALSKA